MKICIRAIVNFHPVKVLIFRLEVEGHDVMTGLIPAIQFLTLWFQNPATLSLSDSFQ